MQFGLGLGEILVWTASMLRQIYPDAATSPNTSEPFQLPPSLETPIPNPQLNQHDFEPILDFNPNNHITTNPIPPLCTFHTPLESSLPIDPPLPHQTWIFLSALLSHRIQALHRSGESVMDTISVKDALVAFENSEELVELGVDVMEVFGGVEGLFVGLVYGGRSDGGEGDDLREGGGKGGDVKSCVEHAIRDIYETQHLSGWMNLESGDDAEDDDGEWVSYLIYQAE